MLDVLIEQNSDFQKLVKVQEKQISTYEKCVEAYREQIENYRAQAKTYEEKETIRLKVEENVKVLVKSFEEEIVILKNLVEVQHKHINELTAKVEELEGRTTSKESSE
jgi:DNA repair exonuclease SbcCD ATPase subunit